MGLAKEEVSYTSDLLITKITLDQCGLMSYWGPRETAERESRRIAVGWMRADENLNLDIGYEIKDNGDI